MSKKIVIVESDASFSKKLHDELAKTGFHTIETGDGKGAYDLCRREKPNIVVLAVELAAGQSGYLVCGKIKKDDDLKRIPVIIIGKDPDGFEGHKKLKTRAEEYLKKPFAPEALTVKVGVLIGLPEQKVSDGIFIAEDESLTLGSLDDDAIQLQEVPVQEIEHTVGNPDLDMLDDAFASMSNDDAEESTQVMAMPRAVPPPPPADDDLGGLNELELGAIPADILPEEELPSADLHVSEAEEDAALSFLGDAPEHVEAIDIVDTGPRHEGVRPHLAAAPRSARPSTIAPAIDDAELKQLRAKVSNLEDTITRLESQLAEKDANLAGARAASAGGGKDVSALKEASLKKDKDVLRLRQNLNERETELVELREKEAAFEATASAHAGELARRDAQGKSLQQKVDQLTAEKKKSDVAVATAKDEARAAAASLATAQGKLDQSQDHIQELSRELDTLRVRSDELAKLADDAKREIDAERQSAQLEVEGLRAELEGVKAELDQARSEHGSLKAEHDQRLAAHAEEGNTLEARISDLEESNAKNEDRVVKAYQKIKGDEKLREKTRKALTVALQLLDDTSGANVVLDEKDLHA